MKVNKLTPKERELLDRAAHFVLIGEWPWDEKKEARERPILERAMEKLRATDRSASRG